MNNIYFFVYSEIRRNGRDGDIHYELNLMKIPLQLQISDLKLS